MKADVVACVAILLTGIAQTDDGANRFDFRRFAVRCLSSGWFNAPRLGDAFVRCFSFGAGFVRNNGDHIHQMILFVGALQQDEVTRTQQIAQVFLGRVNGIKCLKRVVVHMPFRLQAFGRASTDEYHVIGDLQRLFSGDDVGAIGIPDIIRNGSDDNDLAFSRRVAHELQRGGNRPKWSFHIVANKRNPVRQFHWTHARIEWRSFFDRLHDRRHGHIEGDTDRKGGEHAVHPVSATKLSLHVLGSSVMHNGER